MVRIRGSSSYLASGVNSVFLQPQTFLVECCHSQNLEAIWCSKAPADFSKAELKAAPSCTKDIKIHICLRGLEAEIEFLAEKLLKKIHSCNIFLKLRPSGV